MSGNVQYLFNEAVHGNRQAVTGRPLTDPERQLYAPYFPKDALDAARVYDGKVPFWLRGDMDGITLGNDVYFRKGVYIPATGPGVEIFGHELVHVVQYRSGMGVLNYLWESRNGYANNKYEIEAYSKGAQIRSDYCNANSGRPGC